MLRVRSAFASFSVDDLGAARGFYGDKLGLEIRETEMGVIEVVLGSDQHVTIYPKPNHQAATFTVLNFVVPDIDEAVADLAAMGIAMEQYDMPEMQQDAKGIARDPQGPAIAWFKDPAGNILAVISEAAA
jgi:predicted enzyme related to lactoylglutathione lyase